MRLSIEMYYFVVKYTMSVLCVPEKDDLANVVPSFEFWIEQGLHIYISQFLAICSQKQGFIWADSFLVMTSNANFDARPILQLFVILPSPIWCATSVPLGKGTKFALHHGKMSTTKRRAIQILHISTFQFTFECGYNDFISRHYTQTLTVYM